MKITRQMVVPVLVTDSEADVRHCSACGTSTFHVPQKVMVFSAGGARSMRLWACESHPLPENITDTPDE